jgi:hypothetical protein
MKALGAWSLSSFLVRLLGAAWYIVFVVLALAVWLLAASPFIDLSQGQTSIPVSFSVDEQTMPITAPSIGVQRARLEDVRGILKFPLTARRDFVGAFIGLVVMLGFVLWVLHQLRAVFGTLRDGKPFVRVNATRIRRVGWAVIAGELARSAIVYASNSYAMTNFSASGLRFNADLDLSLLALVNGMIVLVIAEVFRIGTRLDEEQSLTI